MSKISEALSGIGAVLGLGTDNFFTTKTSSVAGASALQNASLNVNAAQLQGVNTINSKIEQLEFIKKMAFIVFAILVVLIIAYYFVL
jgi:hypothetical protein